MKRVINMVKQHKFDEAYLKAYIISEDKKSAEFLYTALKILVSAALSSSLIAFFLTASEIDGIKIPTVCAAVFSVIFGSTLCLPKGIAAAALSAEVCALLSAVFTLCEKLSSGLYLFFEKFYEMIDVNINRELADEFISRETAEKDICFFFIVCAVLAALAVSFAIVYKSEIFPIVGAVMLFAAIPLYFGLVPNYYAAGILLTSLFACVSLISFNDGAGKRFDSAAMYCAVLMAAVAALCIIISAYSSIKVNVRPEAIKNARENTVDYIYGGGLNDSIDKLKKSYEEIKIFDRPAERGVLGDNGNIRFSGKTVLSVTIPKSAYPIYLRGYVGSVYTGKSWEDLPENRKQELSEIIGSFSAQGLDPSLLDGYNLSSVRENISYRSFKAEKKARSIDDDVLFMPYNLVPESIGRYNISPDGSFISDGKDEWQGLFYDGSLNYFVNNILSKGWHSPSQSLSSDEIIYRRFVNENYKSVYSEIPAINDVLDSEYMEYISAETETEGKSTLTDSLVFKRKIAYIRAWLRNNCAYDLSVGTLPPGEDFVQWFLTKKEGSCSHFATAAAVICRIAGIPARYVEGYVISPGDFDEEAAVGSMQTVEVKDTRAHAWVEVYIDGFGWYPVEFTPGYGNIVTATPTETTVSDETEAETEVSEDIPEEVTTEYDVAQTEDSSAQTAVTQSDNQDIQTETQQTSPAQTETENLPEETAQKSSEVGFILFGGKNTSGKKYDAVYDLTPFVIAVGAAVLAIVVLSLRGLYFVSISSCSRSKSKRYSVRIIYGRFERLTRRLKLSKSDNETYAEYAARLAEESQTISPQEAKTIIDTALRAEFSKEIISENDIGNMKKAADKSIKRYLSKHNGLKRFLLKTVWGIV